MKAIALINNLKKSSILKKIDYSFFIQGCESYFWVN